MALKGLDIFKLTPKTNCKECGTPTCMAFAMKVAQGALTLDKCPHMSPEALAQLGEATAPPMKAITIGAGDKAYTLGGETVLFRHDKTFVSKSLYAVSVCSDCVDKKLPEIAKIDYERISERMFVELVSVEYKGDKAAFVETVKKAQAANRTLILDVKDLDAAKAALEIVKAGKPVLNGANESNYKEMSALAIEAGVALGVGGANLDAIYDTVKALETLGNKNLIIDVGTVSVKAAFANAVQIRRAALKDGDRSFGYPSLVNIAKLASGNAAMQTALASLFTVKYGSIVVLESMNYAQALPLYGLRQNIYTDPQKPMKVEPGIYPINGADENALCATTVDFALTYFIVSGEIERSGIPVNLLISDAGGYSVLTAWAAGKLSASSMAKFIKEQGVEDKIKSRSLIIPGKVAVLKGELEESLPGWKIIVAPGEAVGVVKFLKELTA
ncbi:acetyl-CoA decarbonylase/synthase complex subunit gamma [Leadbettera azotonutricia]|uniref:CO dehydrogenase/acetyl-CoA synthase delta subunit n=1 Tax=Leadbettera azotonutricia (strain ATCC BAA-888 / DSM 13862 / ZAS-9) TaxID=545695 RepID=F5YDB1_LEAAZ|nr:acetyl-CoA decarbonylase/synthase complex subunit gamma [Leadbettera azotonutricia]AEF80071.1 CO dehydrogenase/acetyl-CoA synthase delta subunit [Leadbettera azotonutricia ZAS-9]